MMKSLLNDWPTYIAHRGASTLAPENSLAAFAKARELGYRAVELDVHRCKTGELVVTHDHWLDRIAGTHRLVEDCPFGELSELDSGSFFNAKFPDRANPAFANERLPTLDAVFETLGPGIHIDIELKTGSMNCGEFARAAAECIERHGRTDCIVSSFNPFALRAYRKYGRIPVAAIYCESDEAPFYMRHRECVLLSRPDIKKPASGIAFRAERPERGPEPVLVWTVDEKADADRLLALGARCVITNRIQDFPRD